VAGVPAWGTPSQPISAVKTANYTIQTTDGIVIGNATGGAFTFTLPSAQVGLTFSIQKLLTDTSFNAITITGTGLSTTLNTFGESVDLFSDGTNWFVLKRYIPSVWTNYSPTLSAGTWGTNTVNFAQWKRMGDSMAIRANITVGGTSSTTATLPLPGGTIDSSLSALTPVGVFGRNDAFASFTAMLANGNVGGVGNGVLTFGRQDASNALLTSANANAIAASDTLAFTTMPFKITGWNG
jgi:hypothetical protein